VKIAIISFFVLLLSGCSLFQTKPVEISSTATDRLPLLIPLPAPLSVEAPQWIVVTPENAEQVWERLQKENTDLVLFGLTDEEYKRLAIMIGEVRNRLQIQREIIIEYKKYYEPGR
jgi:hypothetical protein